MKELFQDYIPKPLGEKKQYSVLIPLIQVNQEWHILYQVRSQHIPQPGEVSFPGGKVEVGESYQEAAVRETCEELLLQENQIDVLGEIDYLYHGERSIHCFVAEINHTTIDRIQPNPEEVERIFTVPLQTLIAQEPTYYPLDFELKHNHSFPYEKIPNGKQYRFTDYHRSIPFYDLKEETLWGMTALFTHRFTQILDHKKNA